MLPPLLATINRQPLAVWLAANVMTGAVNIAMGDAHEATDEGGLMDVAYAQRRCQRGCCSLAQRKRPAAGPRRIVRMKG